MKLSLVVASTALLFLGCPPSPPPAPPPIPDASDASALGETAPVPQGSPACETACAAIAAQHCAEGRDAFCPLTLTKVETDRLIRPALCPPQASGCAFTCAWCATATTGAEVVAKCASSCSP